MEANATKFNFLTFSENYLGTIWHDVMVPKLNRQVFLIVTFMQYLLDFYTMLSFFLRFLSQFGRVLEVSKISLNSKWTIKMALIVILTSRDVIIS